jgi:hypothetical protein
MIVVFGQRFYGKVGAIDGVYVTTRFIHFQMLPFVPLESFLIVTGGAEDRALAIGKLARSVLAAYARIWAFAGLFLGLALGDGISPWLGAPIAIASTVVGVWGWARAGRPSADERAQRGVYAEIAGAPVDVALIARATRGPDAASAQAWLDAITRRAEEIIAVDGADLAASYRELARHTAWQGVAERASTASPACQRAALTLARVACGSADGTARAEAIAAHARIWSAMRERAMIA